MNVFKDKKEAYNKAIESLDERINENMDCEAKDQQEVVKFYVRKRNATIRQMINENIDTEHIEM